jgi:hypothetical protein
MTSPKSWFIHLNFFRFEKDVELNEFVLANFPFTKRLNFKLPSCKNFAFFVSLGVAQG